MRSLPLLLAGTVLLLAPAVSAAWGMPDALTSRGEEIGAIYTSIFVAAIIVFVVVMALLLWVIVRYREGSGHGRATFERSRHNTAAEITWTVIPLGIMLWIGVISYFGLVELDEGIAPGEEDITVHIVGSQWNWEAAYEGGVSVFANPDPNTGDVANTFLIPADKNVLFNITSADVIHAWYMADDNRAAVGLVDANPSGAHEFNHLAVNLPEGDYWVQCREMCFNPGHAYMRAHVQAVPQDEFDLWLAQRQAAAGNDLSQFLEVNITASGIDLEDNMTGVSGSRYVFTFQNQLGEAAEVEAGGTTTTVAPRDWAVVALDTPDAGNYTLTVRADGTTFTRTFSAVNATVLEVDMGAFVFEPETLEFEAGETYLIRAVNVHNTAHNLYIGPSFGQEPIAASPTVGPGGIATFLFAPTESGPLEMWCNVPGHYSLGMFGDVLVEA